MSPLFVRQFKQANKCASCKATKLNGYSLCQDHLNKAKEKWQGWQKTRRDNGVCCYCDRKSYKGRLRCRKHTAYNKAICKAWMAANKEYKSQYDQAKREYWIGQGRCPACKEHRTLDGVHTRCSEC